jgi:hypothetical protein
MAVDPNIPVSLLLPPASLIGGFPFPVMLLREKFVKPLNMLGFQALNPPTMWRIGENPCILPCKQRMSRETGSQQTACTAS